MRLTVYDDMGMGSIGVKDLLKWQLGGARTARLASRLKLYRHTDQRHHASVSFLFPLSSPIHDRSRSGELTQTLFFQPYHPRRRNMTEQQQWIVRSGHRVHLIFDGSFPRPKS